MLPIIPQVLSAFTLIYLPSQGKALNKTTYCEFKTIPSHIIKSLIQTSSDTCSQDALPQLLLHFQLFSCECSRSS